MTLPNVRLRLGGERNQALGDSIILQVRSAGLPCDVITTGEITVSRRMRKPRTLHLRPAMVALPPLRKAVLSVEVPPIARRKAARAAWHRWDNDPQYSEARSRDRGGKADYLGLKRESQKLSICGLSTARLRSSRIHLADAE
ncbi:hypothetical protein [Mycolicibacterium llatzerense]|uniref:hypothetical protein n=1 Tax=Mycolicibacterium llatzerense TaxID=280871 RepID=UPI0021B4E31E|nr:hypothetical protein [Mycolicibacterium llatzerense]